MKNPSVPFITKPFSKGGWRLAPQQCSAACRIRLQMSRIRSLKIAAKYGTFTGDRPHFRCRFLMRKVEAMKKTSMELVAVSALAVSAVAVPAPAHAQRGVAAGVAAGLIGGAIVGGAIASQNGYYGPGYYAPAPGYYGGGPAYVAEPGY